MKDQQPTDQIRYSKHRDMQLTSEPAHESISLEPFSGTSIGFWHRYASHYELNASKQSKLQILYALE